MSKPTGRPNKRGEHFERVAGEGRNRYEGASRAPATWKQYASAIDLFEAWCKANKLRAMPATPETVKRWIVALADDGKTSATVRTYVCGIAVWHRLSGRAFDRLPLAETLRGIKRQAGPQRKARPLSREDLADILASLDPDRAADCRDGALLAIGWAAALRRSEIVGLDWMRKGPQSDARGVLHRTRDGLQIELLRAKTTQEVVVTIDIPNEQMPAAWRWASLWAVHAKLQSGEPIFRPMLARGLAIGGKRLTDHSAGSIIRKRYMALEIARGATPEDAFARALDLSGHSLRVGYVSSAALAGTPEYLIRQRSRHKSAEIVADYVRAAETKLQHGLGKVGI